MKDTTSNANHKNGIANANQPQYGGSNNQMATLQAPPYEANGGSITLDEAKKRILKATRGWGTDEDGVYDAIRECSSRRSLMSDQEVISAIEGDMDDHERWKAFLLMEYGSESNFPGPIKDLWRATEGAGTNEELVYSSLEKMDNRAKNSFKLSYILHRELSGHDLERALDLITTRDSMTGNVYGGVTEDGQPDLVVTEDKLRQLIDSRFVGASSTGLVNAMRTIFGNPSASDLNIALAQIENIRGLEKGSGKSQYDRAISLRNAGIKYYQEHHKTDENPSPDLDLEKNGEFLGTSAQLRFGKIIGDVFGLDPVFGSLISPTGGMAGGGNERIPLVTDGGAVATHGAIHDAAGYLYNCHGIGPGYDYLQSEPGSDPGHHLAGQTNIDWWIKEFKRTGNHVEVIDKVLNSQSYIGAAFSKLYDQLTLDQKKDALKVMVTTNSILLKLGGIASTDRIAAIRDLMDNSDQSQKTELADYFYDSLNGGNFYQAHEVMRPHVSEDVYERYMIRQSARRGY